VFPVVLLQGGQLKPQDLVEWQAFQAQRHWTLEVREAWVLDTVQARLATRAQQQLEDQRQQQQQARDTRQQQRQLDKSPGQQEQQQQQQQQQETSAPDGKDASTAVQPRCDQGDSTVPQADKLIQQAFAQQQDKQQQPTLPPDSTALQRATAGMLCRVQLGAVHSKLMEAKKQRTQQANEQRRQQQQQQQQERQERQQQQQQRSREERSEEKLPPNQPETYDLEVDITARLAGLSSRRQQQQQPKQGSGTSRSSSSSGQASGSRAAASGGRRQQQQQQLGCDGSSSGRDTLLQLLAVGEALFKAEEGCTSDDDQADAQVGLPAQSFSSFSLWLCKFRKQQRVSRMTDG
jgi:hypothetical protein